MKEKMSKLVKFLGAVFLVVGISLIFGDKVLADSTDEVTNDSTNIVDFDSLTKNEQDYFLSKGFTENDIFFSEKVYQTPDSSNTGEVQPYGVNALTLTGATQTVTSTMGRTEYILGSTNSMLISFNMQLRLGNAQTYNSAVNASNVHIYGGGMYYTYTGPRKYHTVKLTAQVLKGFGYGTVSCTAGGLTLGS
ncbi:hypothetical protein DOK78_000045 [Enterococcus sp. DIV2402]|uniref:Uncharacterized protein n=1 Tax=Candidatus Enterococcus lowellii TaxID=2230877 RepID=A0ABZ2SKE9_9ENTE|nr:hypothetical protein [Enterococcus sp. DIV2402]MBO0463075.1 hypothetical protein [Enterococcus sp. DIV2402]